MKMSKIKSILIPSDFSTCSNNALPYAFDLAKKSDASYCLLNVYTTPLGRLYKSNDKLKLNTLSELKQLSKRANISADKVRLEAVEGNVKKEIAIAATELNASLIVIGTRGKTNDRDIFLGSIAKSLVQNAECPVLSIPDEADFKGISKILYATELKYDETEIVNYIIELAKLYDATVVISHVDQSKETKEWSLDMLKDIVDSTSYSKIEYDEIVNSNIEEGINQTIEKHKPDMLAMTTCTGSLIDSIFHFSLTNRMLMHTNTPLLSFKRTINSTIFLS